MMRNVKTFKIFNFWKINKKIINNLHTPQQNQLEKDEPEIRDEISTPTFEYEIAYYTKDHTPIYQFKKKEKFDKQTKVNEERNEDEQNDPLDLLLKSSSIPNMSHTSNQHNYSPIS